MNLRSHQEKFVTLCEAMVRGVKYPEAIWFVTPGGGKSILPVIAVKYLIPRVADKICWVAPRRSLLNQGAKEFKNPEIIDLLQLTPQQEINEIDNGNVINPSRGTMGYAVTCQSIQAGDGSGFHLDEFMNYRYVLILDEAQIFLEEKSSTWAAISRLKEQAVFTLSMMGDIERGDRHAIPILDYDTYGSPLLDGEQDDVCIYTRQQALRDHAIIPIEFWHADGSVAFIKPGEDQATEMSLSGADRDNARGALYTAVRTELGWALIAEGIRHHKSHRGDHILVVCGTQDQAREVKKHIRELYNPTAEIATSDEGEAAKSRIKAFREGRIDCLITVGMAYIGMNNPRITHIISLTTIRSRPWINQMFSRGNRVCASHGAYKYQRCHVFVPDDPMMNAIIEEIRRDQQNALAAEGTGSDGNDGPLERVLPLGSELESQRRSLLDDAGMVNEREQIIAYLMDGYDTTTPEGIAKLFERMTTIEEEADQPIPDHGAQTFTERKQCLTTQIEKYVRSHCYRNHIEYRDMNTQIMRRFNKSRTLMDEEELKKVWAWVTREYPLTDYNR